MSESVISEEAYFAWRSPTVVLLRFRWDSSLVGRTVAIPLCF